MKKLLICFVILLSSCSMYNTPFIVKSVDKKQPTIIYYSNKNNIVLTTYEKYQIGDTIPNVANFIKRK